MAFCNSCGATLNPDAKFCNKCGAAIAGSPASAQPAPLAPPPSKGGSNTVKIILIIAAVIVILGILGIVSLTLVARHFLAQSHVTQDGNHVKVETPFGTAETSKDPEQTVKDLGIDIYPGARVETNGAVTSTIGGIHTVAARFETSDSVDKVCAFYKSRFPNAIATSSGESRCSIISNDQKNAITINIQSSDDSTKFQITNVSKASSSSN